MNQILFVALYFLPIIITGYFFIKNYNIFLKIYRKKINPNFPLLPNEGMQFFTKDPIGTIIKLPLLPLKRWIIIFKQYKDNEIRNASKKVKVSLSVVIGVLLLQFVLTILLIKFNIIK